MVWVSAGKQQGASREELGDTESFIKKPFPDSIPAPQAAAAACTQIEVTLEGKSSGAGQPAAAGLGTGGVAVPSQQGTVPALPGSVPHWHCSSNAGA